MSALAESKRKRAELTPGFDLPAMKLMDFSLQQSTLGQGLEADRMYA